jgi:hypothetical protein
MATASALAPVCAMRASPYPDACSDDPRALAASTSLSTIKMRGIRPPRPLSLCVSDCVDAGGRATVRPTRFAGRLLAKFHILLSRSLRSPWLIARCDPRGNLAYIRDEIGTAPHTLASTGGARLWLSRERMEDARHGTDASIPWSRLRRHGLFWRRDRTRVEHVAPTAK